MDRTEEYFSFFDIKLQNSHENTNNKFYHALFNDITTLMKRVEKLVAYKAILNTEEDVRAISAKVNGILDAIEIKGDENMNVHFNGIKQILITNLLKLQKAIAKKKESLNNISMELEPEKPKTFIQTSNDLVFEQENKKIVENQDYEQTKKRLLKIEEIQKAINEQLVVQDERIDEVCKITGQTGDIYCKISEGEDFSSGSFFRRASSILLICFSFILLFLHFFSKR